MGIHNASSNGKCGKKYFKDMFLPEIKSKVYKNVLSIPIFVLFLKTITFAIYITRHSLLSDL